MSNDHLKPQDKISDRIKLRFRSRLIEWLASIQLTLIGWVLLLNEDTFFENPQYASLADWGTENQWGVFLLLVGLIGIVSLFINGSMSAITPWLRVGRAAIGAMAFALLAVGTFVSWFIYENPPATDLGVFLPAMVFEFISIYNAIIDARVYTNGRRTNWDSYKFNS